MSLHGWVTNTRTASVASLRVGLPILVLALIGFFVTWHFIEPAPPHHVVIAAGMPGGEYDKFAHQYRKFFADNGFDLEVRPTAGSIENYQLLLDDKSGVDVAIVQGGTAPTGDDTQKLQAICSIYFEPLWVFYRSDSDLSRLSQLAGKRIAVGKEGSGVRALANKLLAENGIDPANPAPTVISDLSGQEAADALKAGKLDAVFLVIAPESSVVQDLVHSLGVKLMNFDQADAYAHRFAFLSPVMLYRGIMNLGKDLPGKDVQLIAPAANLVVRKNTHHATVELLIQAARAAHAQGTTLSNPGQFPSPALTDLPLNSDAQYYLRTSPNRILGGLPFWIKSLIDRLLLLLIPLIAVLLPLLRFAPALFRWSVRSRVVRYYTRLRRVEEHLDAGAARLVLEEDLANLDGLARKLVRMSVPAGYMPDLYDLRERVERVRDRVRNQMAEKAIS